MHLWCTDNVAVNIAIAITKMTHDNHIPCASNHCLALYAARVSGDMVKEISALSGHIKASTKVSAEIRNQRLLRRIIVLLIFLLKPKVKHGNEFAIELDRHERKSWFSFYNITHVCDVAHTMSAKFLDKIAKHALYFCHLCKGSIQLLQEHRLKLSKYQDIKISLTSLSLPLVSCH